MPRRRDDGVLTRSLVLAAIAATPLAALADDHDHDHADAHATGGAPIFTETGEPPAYVIRDTVNALGPDTQAYMGHVVSLAGPFFEGRDPDTRGNRIAAEYISFYFDRFGLEPAFMDEVDTPKAVASRPSFEQPFTVRGARQIESADAKYRVGKAMPQALELGEDFNPLGFSANASASAPVAFVGYSIENGPNGYHSYEPGDDLEGHIALMFRFEPIDDEGKSLWTGGGRWSARAGLAGKIEAATERGAAGIILVTAPEVDDPRAEYLDSHRGTSWNLDCDVPAVVMSPEAADTLIRRATGDAHTLTSLRRLADDGEHDGVMPLTNNGAQDLQLALNVSIGEARTVETTNVGGILPGKGALASEYVIIGGHYDHIGYGYYGSRSPQHAGHIHCGADDNASGTAGVLLAAERLAERYENLPDDANARSILFLAFSAEEMGLIGSAHFVRNSFIEPENVTAMINLDMIGRLEDNELSVFGTGTAENWEDIINDVVVEHDLDVELLPSGVGASDHTNFYRADIPVLHLFSGLHDEYHTVRDTWDTINFHGGARIAAFAGDLVYELATLDAGLAFVETGGTRAGRNRTGASVRLGIMPDTAAYASSEEIYGVPVGDVSPGTSAGEAGMLAGDRIVRWGGDDIPDIQAMMAKLREHKPGDRVEIIVDRDGEEVALDVTLQARSSDG